MVLPDLRSLSELFQLLARILPHQLMQLIARDAIPAQQRFVDQRRENRWNVGTLERWNVPPGNGLRRLDRTSAPKHRQPREDLSLFWREQVPGVLERRPHAALSLRDSPELDRQYRQAALNRVGDHLAGARGHSGGGQLDRQR